VRRAGSGRPRLLFLCQTLPYPPDGGVQIRTYNVLRLLARAFDIHALCFFRMGFVRSRENVPKSVAALSEFGRVEAFPIPQEEHRWRLVADHLRSAATLRPYTVTAYDSRAFSRRLETVLSEERFDLVHMDSADLSDYVPRLASTPIVCVHHNVESSLLRSRAATFMPPLRQYVRFQAWLTEREERRVLGRVALNVAVSADDARGLRGIQPNARVVVVPNGVDTASFTPPAEAGDDGLVFVGGYAWQPNRDAMDHFCLDILPHLRSAGVSPRTVWVGNAPEDVRAEYVRRYAVEMTGYVDDIRPWVHRAAVYIAPLRAGGGTRLKILDAWAMGKAVVSTTLGCEGLDARDGDNIVIRDAPAAFAQAVAELLADPVRRGAIGAAARETAVQRYDWDVIGRDMLSHYQGVLAEAGAG
jgi:glycosyltransferase involved in cell wall biosynthesis